MPASLAATKADIYDRLVSGLSDVTVYDHEPSVVHRGVAVTVSTLAVTADFWNVAVRVYVDTTAGPKAAQDRLDLLLPEVEGALEIYGPLAWSVDVLREDGVVVAELVAEVGREDYY